MSKYGTAPNHSLFQYGDFLRMRMITVENEHGGDNAMCRGVFRGVGKQTVRIYGESELFPNVHIMMSTSKGY